MTDVTTVREYEIRRGDTVEAVTIRRTSDPKYPCGWRYALHFGTLDGETILRYDNAHEPTKGHERHTSNGIEEVEFPGMLELFDRFQREIRPHRP